MVYIILTKNYKFPPLDIDRYFIYTEYIKNNNLDDEHTVTPNKIFEVLQNPTCHNPPNPPPPPFNNGHTVATNMC
jgi:hypothetical protein